MVFNCNYLQFKSCLLLMHFLSLPENMKILFFFSFYGKVFHNPCETPAFFHLSFFFFFSLSLFELKLIAECRIFSKNSCDPTLSIFYEKEFSFSYVSFYIFFLFLSYPFFFILNLKLPFFSSRMKCSPHLTTTIWLLIMYL